VPEPQTGETVWVPATVLDCDEASDTYLVDLGGSGGSGDSSGTGGNGGNGGIGNSGDSGGSVDGGGSGSGEGDAAGVAGAAPLRRWLPRVCVCFGAEDPAVYARRYVAAQVARARAEMVLRYNLALDCMPTEGLPQLTTEQVGAHARAFDSCMTTRGPGPSCSHGGGGC
jgi:dynein heavy chain